MPTQIISTNNNFLGQLSAEGNQLISYTGNIPDFEDISIPDLETDTSQECMSPSPSSSTLNTPQVLLNSPSYTVKQ